MFPLSSFLVPGARVGVVGSRDFSCPSLVESFVCGLPEGCLVVSGADSSGLRAGKPVSSCGGEVDAAAWRSALFCGFGFLGFPPEWGRFGKRAGMARNALVAFCGIDVLVVFLSSPGSPSPGSAGVVRLARSAGVPVFVFGPEG